MTRRTVALCRLLVALAMLVAARPLLAGEAVDPNAWTVGIDGMMCPDGCGPTVKSKLEDVDGVETVRVDFEHKAAMVTTKPGVTLTQAACAEALEGTPYTVSRVDPPAAQ
ncbi:MAG: heavy-metal-associated domain-containing protein [bacterium]|nr:heavy-metal-associated domain-containing protein [bacterium]